ncbi:MAG: hypothetical protein IJ762_05240 [Bacteroidaceae bacterium]|nr:hypothetical protein [Bacteroidaceae bacterium]MBR1788576.1 hypothetical protein [Bacteroidaceae bacterium]
MTKTEVAILTAHATSSVSSILNRLYMKVTGQKAGNSGESYEWLIPI